MNKKGGQKSKVFYGMNMIIIICSCLTILIYSCDKNDTKKENENINSDQHKKSNFITPNQENNLIAIEAPPFTEGIFPCSECHIDMELNSKRRPLVDMHEDIDALFSHDQENRWCLDCHSNEIRDSLRLASGRLIGFDESYKLCGQCHGNKLRDWKVGVHGKRTGEWNGKKQYLLCVHCHNPHYPKFMPIKPLPPPMRQKDISLY